MNRLLLTLLWLSLAAVPSVAAAQSDGEALTEGGFNVDLVTGPVLGTGQITGLGGAYSALGDGIDGAAWNPAAYAARTLWGLSWFDWDLSLSVSPGTVGDVDFDNNGQTDAWRSDTTRTGSGEQRFQYAAAGLSLQFGALGAGLLLRVETYTIDLPGAEGSTQVSLITGHYGVAYHWFDGQLVVGGGLRSASLTITAPQGATSMGMTQEQTELVSFNGVGLEAGVLLRVIGQPWRIGGAIRTPVVSVIAVGAGPTQPVDGVSALPKEVRLPWEAQFGVAWQLGERPLNRRWENPKDVRTRLRAKMEERRRQRSDAQLAREQREAEVGVVPLPSAADEGLARPLPGLQPSGRMPSDPHWWQDEHKRRADEEADLLMEERTATRRRQLAVETLSRNYVLFTGEVILVGATDNGVSVESFLSGVRQTAGDRISVGFRAGVELEPIAHWVKLRGGGYLEPSRYPGRAYRPHGTLGIDVRLFTWDLFGWMDPFTVRTGATLDAAERYTSFGLTLGFWH